MRYAVDVACIFIHQKGITNMNKSLKFWSNWLVVMAEVTGFFGMLMVFSPDFFRNTFYRLYTDFYYSRGGAFEALPSTDFRLHLWFYALAGAIMLGWMVLMGFVALVPFRRGEKWAWVAIAATLAVWFVFDCGSSVIYGMSINVIINTVSLITFAIPLAVTYRTFFGAENTKQMVVKSA